MHHNGLMSSTYRHRERRLTNFETHNTLLLLFSCQRTGPYLTQRTVRAHPSRTLLYYVPLSDLEAYMEYPIVLEQDPEAGGYVVYCPTLKGCVSQGDTEEEALDNIKDAIKTYLASIEDLKRLKKLRTVEVSV